MKLVLLVDNGSVGKMTVGQGPMKRTGLRLFHNPMTIEPVLEIFGQFHTSAMMQCGKSFSGNLQRRIYTNS